MASLLDLLFGGSNAAAAAPPQNVPQGMPVGVPPAPPPAQAGSLVQQMAQTAPAAPSNQAPIIVQGANPNPDAWKPHKAGILGQIADYFLDTHFGKENDRRNRVGALEHLTSNPMEAIKRLEQVDPEAAEKLYNEVTDNQRANDNLSRQNRIYDGMNENLVYGRAASAMSGATPDTWGSMRDTMLKMGQARGVDMSEIIPEQYDPTSIRTIQNGAIPMAKQAALYEQHDNHQTQHRDRQASLEERRGFHQGELRLGGGRLDVSETNAQTAQRNADTASKRASIYANANQGRAVNSPAGPGVVDKTGNRLTVFTHDGRQLLYIRGNTKDHWRFAHQIIGQDEKAAGTTEPEIPDDN